MQATKNKPGRKPRQDRSGIRSAFLGLRCRPQDRSALLDGIKRLRASLEAS